MGESVEVELKFAAAGPGPLATLATMDSLGGARLGEPATFDELDRYLDTADGRLAQAGWACRLRSRGARTIISLKGPPRHEPGESLHRRPEVEGPAGDGLPASWPHSAARDLLMRLSDGEPLVERLALAQRRTQRTVRLGGKTGVLTLDAVMVLQADTAVGELHAVELELDADEAGGDSGGSGGATLPVDRLAAALSAIDGLRPDPLTKLEHALRLTGQAP